MINITHIEVFNMNNAFRGLRNPLNSWDKSDSDCSHCMKINKHRDRESCDIYIGPNDLKLAQRMIKAGTDESKFMRQIFVSMDIEAPLYWWKEMDTYKVATVANSCSTMHRLTSSPITKDCFSFDNNNLTQLETEEYLKCKDIIESVIENCEWLRQQYLKTKDKRYWRELVQLLPNAWNQKRTWTANYQVLRNIYFARRHHKLQEWHDFCDMIEKLPYSKELICYEG